MQLLRKGSKEGYQLTLKRSLLVFVFMYVIQTLVGISLSYFFQFFTEIDDIKIISLLSVLIGGSIMLLWFFTDIYRYGTPFSHQIGLQQSAIKPIQALFLALLLLGGTHFLAWVHRSIVLPELGYGRILGGGTEMFLHIQSLDSVPAMIGFLFLALLIAPVMEEFVFRGYLQTALAKKIPSWGAITITSILFMLGHGPVVLWPIYLIYSLAWGWLFMKTKSLKVSILIHILNNLFYTIVGTMGWELLA